MAIETLGTTLRQIDRLLAAGVVTGLSDAELLGRFAAGRDAAAFEALVARHGPMVLSVCRGILRDPNDAEDAFQATFLILVEKAGTFRGPVAMGPWLYRVAYRVALRANAAAARRRTCERRAGETAAATSTPDPATPDETVQALHAEIARLPEKFRQAVILCDLQRVPRARAAAELRLSESTLHRRLGEGRRRLKARLIRRGLASEGGMLSAMLLREARIIVPSAWHEATVRAALATADHAMTAGVVSVAARQWTREVLDVMLIQKLTWASAFLLTIGLIAWGASAALVSSGEEPSGKMMASPDRSPRQRATKDNSPRGANPAGRAMVRGRVLGPDGRPVPGARLYQAPATGYLMKPYPSAELGTTGVDGGFSVTPLKDQDPNWATVVAAAAPGYGPGWVTVDPDAKADDLTIRLVADDVPITGRIIDLEGRPVRGASIRVLQINASPDENLGHWLEAARDKRGDLFELEHAHLSRETIAVSPTVTTDADGRFLLAGMGRDRLVLAQLDGPTIASEYLRIYTRPGETIEVPERMGPPHRGEPRYGATYCGADFRHAAAPSRPIVGVVRDRDTGRPLAGVTIRSHSLATRPNFIRDIVRTTTDAKGRYTLTGLPLGKGNWILAVPGGDLPYPARVLDVPDGAGLDPVTVDVELRRGVVIEGRITDKVTGRPIRGHVQYFSAFTNPNLSDYPGFDGAISQEGIRADEDGTFRVVGLPGPGLVAVYRQGRYLTANERDDEYGADKDSLSMAPYNISFTSNYGALARIDPARGVDSVKRDVTFDPGWTFTGQVLGPDDRPVAGAWGMSIGRIKTAEFTKSGYNPRQPRELLFQHEEKGLVGMARPPKANGDSIIVKLQRGATVTGRLLDTQGRPRTDAELTVWFRAKGEPARPAWERGLAPERARTDRDGRFRIGAIMPGYEFHIEDRNEERFVGDGLRSGEAKDLGDVRMKGSE